MILIRHNKDFYSLHTTRITDASMEEGLYNKCSQYGIMEYEVDLAIAAMMYNDGHNAVHFNSNNRFEFSYKLGGY